MTATVRSAGSSDGSKPVADPVIVPGSSDRVNRGRWTVHRSKIMKRKLLSLVFQSIVFLGLGLLAFWFLIITQF